MPQSIHRGVVVKLGLLAALVCAAALVIGGTSASSAAKRGITGYTIKIKQKPSGRPYFKVPDRDVLPGESVTVVNRTSPRRIGPHSLSLVKSSLVPRTRKQVRNCFRKKHICREIFKWHQGGQLTNVDVGETPGWDTEGDLENTGDSALLLKRGKRNTRPAAVAGTTLHFICTIHPFMHGKITIQPEN